jgi:hypothetical protein
MFPRDLPEVDASNVRALLLEIIRRASYDWVIYRGNKDLMHRKTARDAYVWLFKEGPGHPDWVERERAGYALFAFINICGALDFDPDVVRMHIRKLTPHRIQSMGRPPTKRRPPVASPELDYVDTSGFEDRGVFLGGELLTFE